MSDEPKTAYVAKIGPSHLSVPFPAHPPRLSVALFWAKPGRTPDRQTKLEKAIQAGSRGKVSFADPIAFDSEVTALLEHVLERLKGGLGEAWISRYGYDVRPPVRKPDDTDESYKERVEEANQSRAAMGFLANQPEEVWARAYTEMFVFAPYAGVAGLATNLETQDDMVVYNEYPKVHSVAAACQHLSSYCALTRGIPPASISPGLDASPMNGSSGFAASSGGTAVEDASKRPIWRPGSGGTWAEHGLQPGDCIAGDDGAPLRDGFAHIASVLRRWPIKGPPDTPYKLQWFDTGVLTAEGDDITQDHDWSPAHGKDTVMLGFGEAPKRIGFGLVAEAKDLKGAAEKAYAALPLGFARLVITTPDGTIRYVSGTLPMWHGEFRFRIGDYLWSLRELPVTGLAAFWIIYGVQGRSLFDQVLKEADGPSRTAQAIFDAAGIGSFTLRELAVATSEPRLLRANIKASEKWVDVTGDKEGADAEYAGDAPAETTHAPVSIAVTKGGQAFRRKMKLKLPSRPTGKGSAGGWDYLQSPRTAAKELRVPDLSKVEKDSEEKRAAKEEEERARLEGEGKPVPEKKAVKEKAPVLDDVEVIEREAKDAGVPYFNLSLK
jgi:hypothetical protein